MIRRCFTLALLLVACTLSDRAASAQQISQAQLEALEERAVREAAALAGPSIARIQTVGGLDRVGRVLTGTGPTTGVVVSTDGYIISSAFNFASQPASVLVMLGEVRYPAKVVATDRSKMLTLLKIDAHDLVPAKAAPKNAMRVGQWAIAMGRTYDSPLPNLSLGIVSQLNRIWGKAIQTDCKVSPANYGGPLVDIEGKVLGVLVPLSSRGTGQTAGVEWYDSGIGFAIPLEDVYAALDRLKTGKDLLPGLVGITFKGRDMYGIKPVIDRVRYNSPAEEAGFKPGDEIVEVDGKPVVRQAQVRHALGGKYSEDKIVVVVKRGEKTIRGELTLAAKLPPYEPAFLGVLPARLSNDDSGDKQAGVGVRYVYSESPAAKAGIATFDRVLSFNGTPVNDAATLRDLVSRLLPKAKAKLVFQHNGQDKTVELALASMPTDVPEEIRSVPIPILNDDNNDEEKKKDDAPKTGRFNQRMEAHDHSYWAYVPETYNPGYSYAVMVWIHPSGDTMEAEMVGEWKILCEQRGIILLAPKSKNVGGWKPDEAQFVNDAIEELKADYSIDPNRVFLHGFSKGGGFAFDVAFKFRDQFRGICVAEAPLRKTPPENNPDNPLQFHLICGSKASLYPQVRKTVTGLKRLKYPVSFTTIPDLADEYPPPPQIDEIARWADCLDRI